MTIESNAHLLKYDSVHGRFSGSVNHPRIIGRHAKVMAWYDNEWAFSNRMLDNAVALMKNAGQ